MDLSWGCGYLEPLTAHIHTTLATHQAPATHQAMSLEHIETDRIRRAVAGDRGDLEDLLRLLEPHLRGSLSIPARWRRSLDADDVLQVSFLEAFLRIGSLRDHSPSGLLAWVRRLVQNNLTDAIRGLERDKRPDPRRRVTQGVEGQSARTLLGSVAGEQATAGAQASLKEQLDRLQEAIRGLPESYRRVVQAMDLEEVSVAEVAQRMGRSRGAVHLLRSRAHERLSELLRER